MKEFISIVEDRRINLNKAPDIMTGMGIPKVAQAWIKENKESIDKQFNCFMEMNGQGVVFGIDLANGSDYTVIGSESIKGS